jgi:uncharacterized protein
MVFRILFLLIPFFCFCKNYYNDPWGKGSEINQLPGKRNQEVFKNNKSVKIANKVISFYQNTISPANGPKSNFRPTSSRYMELAIKRYGFLKGFIMGCDRLMRENSDPWVYRTIKVDGIDYKFDPAMEEKISPDTF